MHYGLQLFPAHLLFLGGDEVSTSCWSAQPHIVAWLQANNLSLTQLQAYYESQLLRLIDTLPACVSAHGNSTKVVWQEVFQNFGNASNLAEVHPPHTCSPPSPSPKLEHDVLGASRGQTFKDTLVSVWKSADYSLMSQVLLPLAQARDRRAPDAVALQVVKAGVKVLLSGAWYLDNIAKDMWGDDWINYYAADPLVRCCVFVFPLSPEHTHAHTTTTTSPPLQPPTASSRPPLVGNRRS